MFFSWMKKKSRRFVKSPRQWRKVMIQTNEDVSPNRRASVNFPEHIQQQHRLMFPHRASPRIAEISMFSRRMEETETFGDSTWNWVTECQSEEWSIWWEHVLFRVNLTIGFYFLFVFIVAVLSLLWDHLGSILHQSAMLAFVTLLLRLLCLFYGCKMALGRTVTVALFFVDGLIVAFIYNSLVRTVDMPNKLLVLLPAIVALKFVVIYTWILFCFGIKLTTRPVKIGVKLWPFVLFWFEFITDGIIAYGILQLDFNLRFWDLLVHVISGSIVALGICMKTSCYIVNNLMTTLDERNVSQVIQLYSIGAREPSDSTFPQMRQQVLNPSLGNPSLSRISSIRTVR